MIAPGQRIGHYLIEKRLGAGGMGEVLRAFDESLERPVAIKVLPQAVEKNQEARARMLREARAASALVHPGIVTVHEVDEHDGRIFLVMELVEGETLSQLVARRGKLPVGEALRLVRPVGGALEFAHRAGFVHRDIKCSNLMVSPGGAVKVLDFGLSKRLRREPLPGAAVAALPAAAAADDAAPPLPAAVAHDAAPDTIGMRKGAAAVVERAAGPANDATRPGSAGAAHGRPPSMPSRDRVDAIGPTQASLERKPPANDDLTVAGAAMGTPGYSALELMDGLEADARADVFSLGVVLYELLTATRPYAGKTWTEVRDEIAAERYRRAREIVPSLSSELDEVIVAALRADRAARTPSMAAMLAALAEASAAPRRRRKLALVIGAAAAVSGGAWAVLHLADGGRAPAPSADAALVSSGRGPGPDPIPLDAAGPALESDGAMAPAVPVQVTHLGGCVDAPEFIDEDAIAFGLTVPGGTPDLHLLIPSTGATRPLTDAPTWEWRAARGILEGQLIYVISDLANSARSAMVELDLGSGGSREIAAGAMLAVAAAGGMYYFVPAGGGSLRRLRGKIDEQVVALPGLVPQALAASRDGRWLAVTGRTPARAVDVCLVDLETHEWRCLDSDRPLAGRAAFGSQGALYYGATDGVRARLPADSSGASDHVVVPGVVARGGVAVSPGGGLLVYSDCVTVGSSAGPPTGDAQVADGTGSGELWRLDAAGAPW